MATLGASPRAVTSLLIPPNPAFSSPETHPRGGILLNAGEGSTSPRLSDTAASPPKFVLPLPTPSPIDEKPPSFSKLASGKPPRIRFAPLPDPRPRSLSTGRNIAWTKPEMDGTEARHFEIRGVENQEVVYDDDEESDSDEEGLERDKRGRSWSKTMSWKGTKSLLTTGKLPPKRDDKDSADEGYSSGASLKKSISTGGMIGRCVRVQCNAKGSSPFRFSSQEDRRKSMQGLQVRGISPGGMGHRRNSSLEPGPALGSSAPVVKMLNGRVYGSRRASEIAEFQRQTREKNEPAFIEWGHGKSGSGLGSNAPKTNGGGFLDEEGSGMEWVKKRREERQRKQREEAEQRLRESGSQSAPEDDRRPHLSSSQSSGDSPIQQAITPAIKASDLPPTPRIEVSEHISPSAKFSGEGLSPTIEKSEPPVGSSSTTQAIDIAPRRESQQDRFRNHSHSPRDGDGDDEEEDDDEDDGDFSADEDDEEEEEISRTTAAAAGREVVSRHHD